jgi:uncharacterized protein (TIGR00297 family)
LAAEQISYLVFIGIVAAASSYFKLLSISGAFTALFTGLFIYAGFGLNGLLLMGIFFLTSSLLSKYKRRKKEQLGELHEKGSSRDWAQVTANGGIAALAGFVNYFFPDPAWLIAFTVSLASANADTWASELGVLSRRDPVSIKSLKSVPRGTSGAVSAYGTVAAAAGSCLIALSAYILFKLDLNWTVAIFLLGFTGMMLDTLMGAYLQAGLKCTVCGLLTEKNVHCSQPTTQISGKRWVNNDIVNFLSCLTASFLGMVLYIIFTSI